MAKKITAKIGNLKIGGGNPVVVQTMCNTHTQDVGASVAQCKEMAAAGAQLIRLTTQGLDEVKALKEIKERLHKEGIDIPLVADVHFNSDVAAAAAAVADKVRINPGNFAQVHKDAAAQFKKFIEICKTNNTAVRIGLNHGSLGEEITRKYGNTPNGMKEAAMQWLRMCKENNFSNVVVSLKASNTAVMVSAYRLLYAAMKEDGLIYPVHLGVTEAGNGDQGRIKSAVGIGALLSQGIGDTIRVSLTENPVNEIYAGYTIAGYYNSGELKKMGTALLEQINNGSRVPHATMSLTTDNTANPKLAWEEFIIKASCCFGPLLLDNKIDDFELITTADFPKKKLSEFKENLLQASRRKFTHPEYIACPGCGRTQYNLEKTFNEVKRKTAHLKGLKIAVMGCIVNGPGEMADADYGYVGQGGGKVTIYRGRKPVLKSIPDSEAIDALLKIIQEDSIKTKKAEKIS